MLLFLIRRLLLAIPALLGLMVLTFVLVRVVPADPATTLAGETATPQQVQEIRRKYGFDRPLYEQFAIYVGQVARGDLGNSVFSNRPVMDDVRRTLPATLELIVVSLLLAALIGIPLGILAAERERLWRWVQVLIDTLQTLPSFVYLMPAVMLFRVGDFTAMIAVVAYAVVPAIRYTVLGLRRVDPRLIEAGRAMGCTRWQILMKIRLKLALPEIMLGVNQTIMFALSMLVITALVGTRDLGQEVYIALTKADTGRGILAGLAIAFIAIIADRLIAAGAARTRARLGLA